MEVRLRMVQAEFECEPQTIDTWLRVTIDNPDVDIGHVQISPSFFQAWFSLKLNTLNKKLCLCDVRA